MTMPIAGIGTQIGAIPGIGSQVGINPTPDPAAPEGFSSQFERERAEFDAQRDADKAQQSELESRHGQGETIGLQAARGMLDAFLAPASLVALGLEGAGEIAGSETLRDFGRDLGESATGEQALGAMLFGVTGDIDAPSIARRQMAEQERAHPLLSTASRIAGSLVPAGATGGLGTGGAVAATAIEAGGFGAQAAYEQQAPLRDVITSTLLSGTLGLGAAAAGGFVARSISRRAAEKETQALAREAWQEATTRAEGAIGSEAGALVKELGQIQGEIRKASRAATTIEGRKAAEVAAREAGIERIAKKAGPFDAATWATKTPTPLQKAAHRSKLLDQVSADLSQDIGELGALRVGTDFAADPRVVGKLLKNISDAPGVSAKVQGVVAGLSRSAPATARDSLRTVLRGVSEQIGTGKIDEVFVGTHEVARRLETLASRGGEHAEWATQAAARLRSELASDAFGDAGAAYRRLLQAPSDSARMFTDAQKLRVALRSAVKSGDIQTVIGAEAQRIAAQLDARAALTGIKPDKAIAKQLAKLNERAAAAERAVMFDGGNIGRVSKFIKDQLQNRASDHVRSAIGATVGGAIGGLPGSIVMSFVAPAVAKLVPGLTRGAGRIAGRAATGALSVTTGRAGQAIARRAPLLLREEKALYAERMERIDETVARGDVRSIADELADMPELPDTVVDGVLMDYQARVVQLQKDMPRPRKDPRGKAFEALSRQEVKLGNAMYEATMEPLSVFDDFEAGAVDYDKVQYAWKQNPGLKQMCQLGLVDILESQLDEDTRAQIPGSMLTSLDYFLDFRGTLQGTVDRGFSAMVDQAQAEEQEQRDGLMRQAMGQGMQVPTTARTRTETIANMESVT